MINDVDMPAAQVDILLIPINVPGRSEFLILQMESLRYRKTDDLPKSYK